MNQLFVNDLTVIDFSYFDNQRGILGESWIVDIELSGELDEQGMVFDFGHVKKRIKAIIDEELDHRFVISNCAKEFKLTELDNETTLTWKNVTGCYEHVSPANAIVVMDEKTINKKAVKEYLEQILIGSLPKNVESVKLTLRDEHIDGAYYHYSHGLKKHEGNCQRIVHGHRSRIEILENSQRSETLEDYWSACFRNIYIGTREDTAAEIECDGKPHTVFTYRANQGRFSLTLPSKRVYLFDTDTTVELIASHIAEECLKQNPGNHYLVRAFEGVGKGAVAIRS